MQVWEGAKDDLASAAAIEESAFGDRSWGAASFEKTASSPGVRLLLAGRSRAAAQGFALWLLAGEDADLLSIGVAPEVRRQGVGRLLLDALEIAALEQRARRLLLDVADDNRAALALYRACGFYEISRRAAYYRNGADALILEKPLNETS